MACGCEDYGCADYGCEDYGCEDYGCEDYGCAEREDLREERETGGRGDESVLREREEEERGEREGVFARRRRRLTMRMRAMPVRVMRMRAMPVRVMAVRAAATAAAAAVVRVASEAAYVVLGSGASIVAVAVARVIAVVALEVSAATTQPRCSGGVARLDVGAFGIIGSCQLERRSLLRGRLFRRRLRRRRLLRRVRYRLLLGRMSRRPVDPEKKWWRHARRWDGRRVGRRRLAAFWCVTQAVGGQQRSQRNLHRRAEQHRGAAVNMAVMQYSAR